MAGGDLYSALSGLNYSPTDNNWALGAQAVGAGLPTLYNPYQGAGTNFGIAFGGALLQGLLGFQARRQAAEDSIAANQLGLKLLQATTPEARLQIAASAPDVEMQSRLLGLNTQLQTQSQLTDQLINQEILKRKALADIGLAEERNKMNQLAEFELSDLGRKQAQRKLEDLIALEQAKRIPTSGIDPDVKKQDQQIARYAQMAGNIADRVEALNMSAPEFEIQRRIPGSEAELVYSLIQGNLANFARLGGNQSQISDVDRNDQFNSLFGPDVPGLGRVTGTTAIANRIREKIKMAPISSNFGAMTGPDESAAKIRNKELKEKLKRLEELAAQRK
ncbi:hypothetical protein EBZ38_09945 [bacterium]|nr:hypothetical protein [bacterium]